MAYIICNDCIGKKMDSTQRKSTLIIETDTIVMAEDFHVVKTISGQMDLGNDRLLIQQKQY